MLRLSDTIVGHFPFRYIGITHLIYFGNPFRSPCAPGEEDDATAFLASEACATVPIDDINDLICERLPAFFRMGTSLVCPDGETGIKQ